LGFMAGLGHLDPEPFFVWHQDMVFFFGFTATSLEQSMRNPWRLGPNFETYPH
jgi:hypothetical protein